MLRRLFVRNFVIVPEAQLDFESGFTVLTGETGAGKSILIDALSLVLGERGDASVVRPGAKQAEISAEFELHASGETLEAWLRENALEGDAGICLVRRIVDLNGRTRAFINGHPCTVTQLRELAEWLLDIHGQHEHQSLLRPASQRELVDAYGGSAELCPQVAAAYRRWKDLDIRHQTALRDSERIGREREALAWQVNELSRLEFNAEHWSELNAEHARLTHASTLIETASGVIDAIAESEQSSLKLLNGAISRVTRAGDLDPGLQPVIEILQTAQIDLQEAVHALDRYRSKLDIDPRRLSEVEREIERVHDACRKFHLRPEVLDDALASARGRLAALDLDLDLKRLEREVEDARLEYHQHASALSQARKKSASRLSREVSNAMQELALAGAKFSVNLERLAEPAAHGLEKIEFFVASHAGGASGPLAKIASGGELSRVSLALQTVLSQVAQVPTLIFDEVDAGIGGRVAEIVGQMLHRLSSRHQVMCVTHLAQVAASADHHYRVTKLERSGATTSQVEALGAEERVREIARMLGGARITPAALEHAAEMLREARRPLSAV